MNENPFENQKPKENLSIRIEIAREDDWETCKRLRLLSISGPSANMLGSTPEILEQENNKTEEEWRMETNSDEMFSVLAYDGSEAVGLGRTKLFKEGLLRRKLWRLRNGYVDPKFEGRGIQTKMIALRLKEAIRRKGTRAITSVRPGNPVSLHNIQKFGFQIVKTEKDGRGGEWLILYLDLTNPAVSKKVDEVLNER